MSVHYTRLPPHSHRSAEVDLPKWFEQNTPPLVARKKNDKGTLVPCGNKSIYPLRTASLYQR